MRNNQPVSNIEYHLTDDAAIISRTDKNGRIVSCNTEFCEASGFDRAELIGSEHNIVRHPDMPSEAYRDMWDTLKRDRPWSGIVKNRRKDGSHYWVRANVTPLPDKSGYMSVRIAATREEIRNAEALYARMRSDASVRLHEGELVTSGVVSSLFTPFFRLMQRTISIRIMAGFVVTLIMMGAVSLWASMDIKDASVDGKLFNRIVAGKDLVADILPPPAYILESYMVVLEMRHKPASDLGSSVSHLQQLKSDYDKRLAYWSSVPMPDSLKESFISKSTVPVRPFFDLAMGDYLNALQKGNLPQADADLSKLQALYTQQREAIDRVVEDSNKWNDALVAESRSHVSTMQVSLLLLVLSACVIGSFFTYLATRSVKRPLLAAGEAAGEIANGNLLCAIPVSGNDEIGALAVKLAIMRNNLHEIAASLKQEAYMMKENLDQLRSNAGRAAHSAEAQSISASSLAAAIEQMSVSIDQINEHAQHALALSSEASGHASAGGKAMTEVSREIGAIAHEVTETASSITQLEKVSEEISSVVDVIRGVADQTNLLALNAAIEAARAGETGRGFAVVADEVRTLAERTGTSTTEISQMIANVQALTQKVSADIRSNVIRVESGSALALTAGESVSSITDGSDAVFDAMNGIKHSVAEQSTAARDIARSVEQIASTSGENAKVSNDMFKAADIMSQQAEQLGEMTRKFNITRQM